MDGSVNNFVLAYTEQNMPGKHIKIFIARTAGE